MLSALLTAVIARARSTPDLSAAALIFFGFLILRIPFRAEFLVNWDAVNFALGTQLFSLQHHQPHPPGYIGYIGLGWLLNHITGDPNISLTLISVVSGAAAPVALFLLASHFMPRRYAIATAVLFGLSPIVWYYSRVALTYSMEGALALLFLWAAYAARSRLSVRHLILATVLLVVLGAVRQSGALFLMPLWVYTAWPFAWRERSRAFAVLTAGNLIWLVPLFWLSGDPITFIRESAGLASFAVAPTTIFALNPWGLGQNVAFVFGGILLGVNVGFLIIAAAHWQGVRPISAVTRADRIFFLLWLAPAMLVYLLVHTGQLGYILFVLPAGFLWAGAALAGLVHERSRALAPGGVLWRVRRHAAAGLTGTFAIANVFVILFATTVVYGLTHPEEPNAVQRFTSQLYATQPLFRLTNAEDGKGLAARARQYDVRQNDAHWEQLIDAIKEYDPEQTAVLAVPDGAGSFRHLVYYLSDYRTYGLGKDLDENFGHLFTAYAGTSDYTVGGLKSAGNLVKLPPHVIRLIIPDRAIYGYLDDDITRAVLTLDSGYEVVVAIVEPGAPLQIEALEGGTVRISAGEVDPVPPRAGDSDDPK